MIKESESKNRIDLSYLEDQRRYLIQVYSVSACDDSLLYDSLHGCPYGLPFVLVLEDAIEFVKRHCPKDEKISFELLCKFNMFTSIEVCDLKTLFDFISEYVEQNGNDLGSIHIKSKSKIKAREMVEIKIESSLS